ncbi:chloride channel protein [Pseudodonghicola flavimaris]|uniref:Chloride channel protein n=1 Tax=Pseudodonghicola flavimaris TaxID=3050036 RepID=A0ABT7F036_9RHOB|nr:chloride channel protein [Pseudodonghicola flavimaris]MDK3017968.1 chloride channel protein [Pseudodonghicola flavimaris]
MGFRMAIDHLQTMLYGTDDLQHLHSFAQTMPWYLLLLIPVTGGLVVGLILNRFTDDGRVCSVADVIEGAALNDGRVGLRAGIASAIASMITLSSGGSSGREGPVVHLAAVIASKVSDWLKYDGVTARDLLGCAVAAAVSASFNAPIAGSLFAMEVILRHFAIATYAPIVIAAVAGTVVNRLAFGNIAEFTLPQASVLDFYEELPAYLLLGLVCGLVAVVLMRSIFWAESVADRLQQRTGLPAALRPAVAGLLLGVLAIGFPHVIGVGYETTAAALTGQLLLFEALGFAFVKAAAVSITIGGRMGGGVFSPSLMMGALTGLVFGILATAVFPEVSGSETLYALAGMGAVAAAVLGAPISTTLIVFELTGDWQTGIAVTTSVSLSTALASRLVDRSFFLTQLERRGIHLAAGPQAYLLAMLRAGAVMRPAADPKCAAESACRDMVAQGLCVEASATLEAAMPIFDRAGVDYVPVILRRPDKDGEAEILGALFQVDALKAYNRALAATAAEEHS